MYVGPIHKANMLKTPVPAVMWKECGPSQIRGSANSLLVSARISPAGWSGTPQIREARIKGANTVKPALAVTCFSCGNPMVPIILNS